MKRLVLLGGGAGLGAVALLAFLHTRPGHAADHLDGPLLQSNPMADINDLYTWMDPTGTRLNLALTVSPGDPGTRTFGPSLQYVFHVTSKPGLGVAMPGGTETRVVCTFASDTNGQCWVIDAGSVKDHVSGDPSMTTGLTSASGKLRLFAGRRSDPFFFNLQGFRDAVGLVRMRLAVPPPVTLNEAGCPSNLTNAETTTAAGLLSSTRPVGAAPCPGNQADCFAMLNTKVILVQLDKSLVNVGTNTAVGVWASTHTAP